MLYMLNDETKKKIPIKKYKNQDNQFDSLNLWHELWNWDKHMENKP